MPELRWTLLIVGGLFVLGLALWEIRRQRQAPRQNRLDSSGPSNDRTMPPMEAGGAASGQPPSGFADGARVYREPIITLPELQPMDPRGEPRIGARREPAHDPPVVEVDDASFSRLQEGAAGSTNSAAAHDEVTIAMTVDDDFGHIDADLRDAVARRAGLGGEDAAHAEEVTPDDAAFDRGTPERAGHGGVDSFSADSGFAAAPSAPRSFAAVASEQAPSADAATHGGNEPTSSGSIGFGTDADDQHSPADRPLEGQPRPAREAAPVGATAAGAPKVDWPTDASRKIVALRLVSQPAARFPGRAVRQALAAEGFVLGKFDIFHKAGPDDRAVLSAASLTKPGTFTMNTIDGQRFGGISLFAVLPGPLPAQETFDELLHTARALNDRLQGALQDERGEPLTPMRSASIRQSLSEGNGSAESDVSVEPVQAEKPQSETRQ